MRYLLLLLALITSAIGLILLPACSGGGEMGGDGNLIADYDLEGEEYLADPDNPFTRLCRLLQPGVAFAGQDLSWDSNSYPLNIFTGERNAEAGLNVIISAPDMSFVAQGVTSSSGRVTISNLPTGFLTMTITGQDGHNYNVPIQINEDVTSRTRVLVFRNPDTGGVEVTAKTFHDTDGDSFNDDDFSYALYGRPRDQQTGGQVHLHIAGETRIDANGDGDFNDPGDEIVIEPDDDGQSSEEGDGDEDNDYLLDNVDPDIDGDDIPNGSDDDMDGDGIPNDQDDYPDGVGPNDDFNPPLDYMTGEPYMGILDAYDQESTGNTAVVVFPKAYDDENDPVTYRIYWSTTTPIDFDTAQNQLFKPLVELEIYEDNVTGLVNNQT